MPDLYVQQMTLLLEKCLGGFGDHGIANRLNGGDRRSKSIGGNEGIACAFEFW
jgi:hypothetical protein